MMPQPESPQDACVFAHAMTMAPRRSQQVNNTIIPLMRGSHTKMKKQVLAALLSLGLCAAPAIAIQSVEQAYIDSYRGRTGTPIPVEVKTPIVSTKYAGSEVKLEFSVDESGRPRRMVSRTPVPIDLMRKVMAAVERWEFIPLRDANGQPIPARVILPVRIKQRTR
jgi:hypothetical protein